MEKKDYYVAYFDGACEKIKNILFLMEYVLSLHRLKNYIMEEIYLKAWMAGFIDGEGCITISKQVRKNRPSPQWRPLVTIANTNIQSLEIFKQNYGGTLRFNAEKRSSKTGIKWSDSWTWYCPQGKIMKLMNDIYLYSIIKKPNIDIMIDFMNHIKSTKRLKGGRRPNGSFVGSNSLSKEVMDYRDFLRDKIHDLNSGKRFKQSNI